MEHIRQAIELAKGAQAPHRGGEAAQQLQPPPVNTVDPAAAQPRANQVELSNRYLESKRVVAHDIVDGRSKSFDMLRTQILQAMDTKSWQLLAVTSPTAGCGKTMVATNLAISIARQPHRSVLLVDMDLQKPQVANTLGLKSEIGLVSVLEGHTRLQDALVQAHVANEKFLVLPCPHSTLKSSAWMASQSMASVLQEIRRDFRSWTVILDLPPMLTSDDVISILPQIDCVLFVVAAGMTTVHEIKECNKHLQSASVARVVLNKATDQTTTYYTRYADDSAARMARAR